MRRTVIGIRQFFRFLSEARVLSSTPFDDVQHFAFVHGRIGDGRGVPVRLHRADIVKDVLGGNHIVNRTLERFAAEGRGVLVSLRDGTAGVPISSVSEEGTESKRVSQWREIGVGAQILRDLGVTSIRHLTSSAHDYKGLSGFGIEIVANEPFDG